MSLARTLPLAALIACNGGLHARTNDTSGDTTTSDTHGIDGTPDSSAQSYTDKWGIDGTDPDCEELVLSDCTVHLAGATRFYVGELTWDDAGAVGGYEADVLFANQAWKDTVPDAGDCQIVWTITGTKEDGPAPYTYTVNLHAAVNQGASDCIPGLTNAATAWDGGYHVSVNGNGDATVYFGVSGNLFATGIGDASGVSYVSDGGCEWYGSDTCQP